VGETTSERKNADCAPGALATKNDNGGRTSSTGHQQKRGAATIARALCLRKQRAHWWHRRISKSRYELRRWYQRMGVRDAAIARATSRICMSGGGAVCVRHRKQYQSVWQANISNGNIWWIAGWRQRSVSIKTTKKA